MLCSTVLVILFQLPIFLAQKCTDTPLGMENGVIPDSSISASSEWDQNHGAINARLNFKHTGSRTGAWSAKTNDINQWLKVDFGGLVQVTRIQIQGREDCCNQFVKSYAVSYSHDDNNYQTYMDNGQERVFTGSNDAESVVTEILPSSIVARYVRIHPRSWNNHISMRVEIFGCPSECIDKPLGMESGVIPDSSISASSEWDQNHGAINARLNFKHAGGRTGAWSAKTNDINQWLKVDFGGLVQVTRIQIQGREDCCNQFVKSYAVSYSQDGNNYQTYTDNGQERVFTGSNDAQSIVTEILPSSIVARYVRIHPRSWNNHISMRVEIFGCPSECIDKPLGMESGVIPDSSISASSEWDQNHGAINARLNFKHTGARTGAWSAKTNDQNQWLKADFGGPVRVTQIQIQGREDCCNQFVKSYAISYSHDDNNYQTYMDNGQERVFTGSHDAESVVTEILPSSIVARYVRIHPRSWNNHISMRVEFLGCTSDDVQEYSCN